ncbi:hypothetical protein N9993_01435 [bacterium]|jgi:hypothetical protein|nr:hypothetical protein [bacterium]
MKLNARELQKLMGLLRNVAEVDPEDVISNCASQLAYELETVKVPFDTNSLNEKRQQMVKYAISKRNKYRLTPGARHAIVVE